MFWLWHLQEEFECQHGLCMYSLPTPDPMISLSCSKASITMSTKDTPRAIISILNFFSTTRLLISHYLKHVSWFFFFAFKALLLTRIQLFSLKHSLQMNLQTSMRFISYLFSIVYCVQSWSTLWLSLIGNCLFVQYSTVIVIISHSFYKHLLNMCHLPG